MNDDAVGPPTRLASVTVADLKPAYLFTGDDDVRIDQARKRLALRAQADGAQLQVLHGDACTPREFAVTLTSQSLLPGRRIVLADGVENWRAADVAPAADALQVLARGELDAVAVLICRKKPLKAIVEAVTAAGGEIREFKPPSATGLPAWLCEQAGPLGVELDRAAAELLIERVGEPAGNATAAQRFSPKRRLLSELEKLALMVGRGGTITRDAVEHGGSGEASAGVFALTDAAVAGDRVKAIRIAEELLAAGEPPPRIVALLARAFGQAQQAAALAESGRADEIAGALKLPPWLAAKIADQARARGGASLRAALIEVARLDDAVKGGSPLDGGTELIRTIDRIAG